MEGAQYRAGVASSTIHSRGWKNDLIFFASAGSCPPLLSLSDRPPVPESWYKPRHWLGVDINDVMQKTQFLPKRGNASFFSY